VLPKCEPMRLIRRPRPFYRPDYRTAAHFNHSATLSTIAVATDLEMLDRQLAT